jgi:hypothetical protein
MLTWTLIKNDMGLGNGCVWICDNFFVNVAIFCGSVKGMEIFWRAKETAGFSRLILFIGVGNP